MLSILVSESVKSSLKARGVRWFTGALMLGMLASAALAGTFGTVVPVSGHIADLALDEGRGVVYLANMTASRIDVVSVAAKEVQRTIAVSAHPDAIALSRDGRFLAVTHYGRYEEEAPDPATLLITVIELDSDQRVTVPLNDPPLGIAFGSDNRALVLTTRDFLLLNPESGSLELLGSVEGISASVLPAPPATPLVDIMRASVAASGNGRWIYGIAETTSATETVVFRYDVENRQVASGFWVTSPILGPRSMTVSHDGSFFATGWGLFNAQSTLLAQFRNSLGTLAIGSVGLDSNRNLVYAHLEQGTPEPESNPDNTSIEKRPPILLVADGFNLTIYERLKLAEGLTGKSTLASDGSVMYSVSESGLTILPVGSLNEQPRVVASVEDVLFLNSFCDRRLLSQEIDIVNPGGGNTDFTLVSASAGVRVTPSSGTTPARVRVEIDPNVFQNHKGTSAVQVEIQSEAGVNIPPPVRVLINMKEADQRGTIYNVPGKLVDILADPGRNRFYILRQDKNRVLVFDGSSYTEIASLPTGNTPTQLAMTFDQRYLLIGNDDSQIAYVYDLDTLDLQSPVVFPSGHYPRSIAASGNAILAASRVAGPKHKIDRVNFSERIAEEMPALSVFENSIHEDTMLSPSASGGSIFIAQADGNTMMYSAGADDVVMSRKEYEELSGAYAALSDDRFVVDNNLLSIAMMPVQVMERASGSSSGFARPDWFGLRTTAPLASSPGIIQKMTIDQPSVMSFTKMAEAPLLSDPNGVSVFTRTLAGLPQNRMAISLTTSGFTVLPWEYETDLPVPQIAGVRNLADGSDAVAPGGLIFITGSGLSTGTVSAGQLPAPTVLGESCLLVNGVPVPMLMVSPDRVNAQLPFNLTGTATMVIRTPGGSDEFQFTVRPTAPAVLETDLPGGDPSKVPTIFRAFNGELVTLSNPVHPEDTLVIYLTGLGAVAPGVEPGTAAPPSQVIQPGEVTLGGVSLPVLYSGLAPGLAGVYQINVTVPYWVPKGWEVPLVITQGGQTASVNVRVVK